jgi:hypothetical protein
VEQLPLPERSRTIQNHFLAEKSIVFGRNYIFLGEKMPELFPFDSKNGRNYFIFPNIFLPAARLFCHVPEWQDGQRTEKSRAADRAEMRRLKVEHNK